MRTLWLRFNESAVFTLGLSLGLGLVHYLDGRSHGISDVFPLFAVTTPMHMAAMAGKRYWDSKHQEVEA